MIQPAPALVYRRGLHLWAVLTAAACFPLVLSGGLVTSTGVGMVDPTWEFTPFRLFTPAGIEQVWLNLGMLIEHGHRQIGFIVGMMAIVLAIWCWQRETGRRRWLGVAALVAVSLQGALGAARILFDAQRGIFAPHLGRDYAALHGFTGQLVFVGLVLVALLLSKSWITGTLVETTKPAKLKRLARLTALLATAQLALGVALRHWHGDLFLWLHLLFATAVAVHVILVLARTASQESNLLQLPSVLLATLLGLQLCLGVGAWWFGGGTDLGLTPQLQLRHRVALTSAHQALGALFLAVAWVVAARAAHHLAVASSAAGQGVPAKQEVLA